MIKRIGVLLSIVAGYLLLLYVLEMVAYAPGILVWIGYIAAVFVAVVTVFWLLAKASLALESS
ncbi:hypothetical protein D8Y22_20880 [Salinadaptatus halalkaliphilus]|uniref:Uncharacterized protein n=1 Tax=Salinadaptatus halalkaliphilus TaxID=2419781 RepID=A0A4S3THE7_9EURY|nr:hypothetical protein [Salinadaptatus halalkaliphilus]THE62910.1 hypothetical protein D8Y22_20880 [Salinadaptatus halalkaliphilus]